MDDRSASSLWTVPLAGGKDFRDRAIVLTSKDANLTKAHACYLESKFISLATLAGDLG
jgi:hypothetical protein